MLIEGPLIADRVLLAPPADAAAQQADASKAHAPETKAQPHSDPDAPARIGPHAVIHMAEAIEERLGRTARKAIMANAQLDAVPPSDSMIPEVDALRLHRWLLMWEPVEGFAITREAARRTADYIIANRIPAPARMVLKALPAALAAPLLMRAIRSHAWTFIGAGDFRPQSAWAFTIDRSKAGDPVPVPDSTFEWYAEVFERLYQRLVAKDCRIEMSPVSGPSQTAHEFRLVRGGAPSRA